jgi:lipoate-protein ligase A
MILHLLPGRTGGAAENMACDFLLLQRYPDPAAARFRHYGWRAPAFTFGYSQKIAFVRSQLPSDGPFDLCRRASGGGVVDHREDWTYALIVPRGHPLEAERAALSYRLVHAGLAEALRAQGAPAALQEPRNDLLLAKEGGPSAALGADSPLSAEGDPSATLGTDSPLPRGICFEHAETHDVINPLTGAKIAGAAQKRNKHGLLFQGSVWRPAAGPAVDWERFREDFSARLAAALAATPVPVPWPDLNEDEVSGLTERYASPEWLEQR